MTIEKALFEDTPDLPSSKKGKVPTIKSAEGQAAFDAIIERKRMSARRDKRVSRAIAYSAMAALPLSLYFFGAQLWTYFLPFPMFLWFTDDKPADLTKKEYYSIPGSLTKAGKHACLYCGSSTVERHYYGRSNTEVVYCAGCEKKLY